MNTEALFAELKAAGFPADVATSDNVRFMMIFFKNAVASLPVYREPENMERLWREFEELRRTMLKVIKDLGPRKPWWRVW